MSGYKPGCYYGHSANDNGAGVPEFLSDHLKRVAECLRRFASAFGAEEQAHAAGLLHDLGNFGGKPTPGVDTLLNRVMFKRIYPEREKVLTMSGLPKVADYYARTAADGVRKQLLRDHLRNVAALARSHAEDASYRNNLLAETAYLSGLLHDGKVPGRILKNTSTGSVRRAKIPRIRFTERQPLAFASSRFRLHSR